MNPKFLDPLGMDTGFHLSRGIMNHSRAGFPDLVRKIELSTPGYSSGILSTNKATYTTPQWQSIGLPCNNWSDSREIKDPFTLLEEWQ